MLRLRCGLRAELPPRQSLRAELAGSGPDAAVGLVLLFTGLLAVTFPRQGLLYALLFTWFQVERVPLHFLDDVFRLHFALETTESILERLAFLNTNFSQRV